VSRDFEYSVRQTVNAMADEARSVNLSEAAMRQGRRMVARRRALSVAAAFACVAALTVPFALLATRHSGQQAGEQPQPPPTVAAPSSPPVSAPQSAPAPVSTAVPQLPSVPPRRPGGALAPGAPAWTVVGGWIVTSAPYGEGTLVYNSRARRYVLVPFDTVVPSPAGAWAAVATKGMVGVVNLSSPADVTWIKARPLAGAVDWAPNGIELTFAGAGDVPGKVQLYTATVKKQVAESIGAEVTCADDCAPVWSVWGDEVSITDADGLAHTYAADTGKPIRTFPVPGPIVAGHSWSPRGDMVAARAGTGTQIVKADDSITGPVLDLTENAAGLYWYSEDVVLCIRTDGVAIYQLDGTQRGLAPLPVLKVDSGAGRITLGQL
jgi:hypothetical protein